MKSSVTVNYDGVKAMAGELARVSGKDYAYVLRQEGASMIKIAALRSPVASGEEIKRQTKARMGARFAGSGGLIVTQRSGRTWFTQDGRVVKMFVPANIDRMKNTTGAVNTRGVGQKAHHGFYMIFDKGPTRGWHVPDPIWSEYLITAGERDPAIKARTAELLKRRGLERVSWLQMGDAMGVALSTVAPQGNLQEDTARGASANGRQFHNGSAAETTEGANFVIVVTNASPIAIKRDGQRRLDQAINQRVRGFEIACAKGLLSDLTRRAARWPGIFVTPA